MTVLSGRVQQKDNKLKEELETKKNLEQKYQAAKNKFDINLADLELNAQKIRDLGQKISELKARRSVALGADLGSRLRSLREKERAKISIAKEKQKQLGKHRFFCPKALASKSIALKYENLS